MANYGFLNDPEDEDFTSQASPYINGGGFGGGLLSDSPRNRGFSPDLGMLGLAAGLLQPTRGGNFAQALGNGFEGWASGIGSQRKLDQMDEEIANARMKRTGKNKTWGMSPFVDSEGNVYQLSNDGDIRHLTDMHGRFVPPQTVDTGNGISVINPNRPNQPLGTIEKGLNPVQQREWNPNRYTQTPGADGSTVQTDTSTGRREVINNPNAPKAPPAEYTKTLSGFDNFGNAIDKYIGLLRNRSLTDVGPKKNLDLESAYGDLMLINKDIYGLGVLNAGDKPALERVLRDPTAPSSLMYSNDDLIKQAEAVKKDFMLKRKSLQDSYRSSGYRVDEPNTPVRGQAGNVTADFASRKEAEDYYNSQPDGPEKEALGQILNQTKPPYAVNKSSVPTLKKPTADTLNAARAKINEYQGDPTVRNAVIKRLQDAGYDTTGL